MFHCVHLEVKIGIFIDFLSDGQLSLVEIRLHYSISSTGTFGECCSKAGSHDNAAADYLRWNHCSFYISKKEEMKGDGAHSKDYKIIES